MQKKVVFVDVDDTLVRTVGTNQQGTEVCTFVRTMLIAKRGHSVEDKVNY